MTDPAPASTRLPAAASRSSLLYNPDLAPTASERRTWGTYNYCALWVSMSVNILTYMLAAGLIQQGMNWRQAIVTIFLGNLIVLVPMLLNAHAGARYGIPFPVFARCSFGVLGANIPAIARALVACGWFGIQTWIGGQAINGIMAAAVPSWRGYSYGIWICFFAFWLLNLIVILRGIDTIKFLQGVSAPFLIAVGLALLGWAYFKAGGFGPMLSTPTRFKDSSEFFAHFIPALTGTVAFWSTLALNIPDFTRFARGQREQMLGQALGLPTTMTLYSFIGVAVTSATLVIFGQALWNPVDLLQRFESPVAVIVSLLAIVLATLNVNVGANLVSPANDFSNVWPRRISFRTGGVIACFVGIALQPWKLVANPDSYIMGWLNGYACVLGPVAGILIADYFVLRKRIVLLEDLYIRGGFYEFSRGFNPRAVVALALGMGTALIGLVVRPLRFLYDYSWFIGFAVGFVSYVVLMRSQPARSTLPVSTPAD